MLLQNALGLFVFLYTENYDESLLEPGTYYGTISQRKHVTNIILSETKYDEFQKIPPYIHENFYICYLVKGRFSEFSHNKTYLCDAGDVIFHPASQEHSDEFNNSKSTCFNIEYTGGEELGFVRSIKKAAKFSNSSFSNCIQKAYKEFKFEDPFPEVVIEGLILESLGYLSRESQYYPPYWLKKAREIINDSREYISFSYLAGELNISPSYLCREFKRHFGLSIGEYKRHLKIVQAGKQLTETNDGFLKIALDLGFADQSYFSKTFKKVTWLTPGQFRSTIR